MTPRKAAGSDGDGSAPAPAKKTARKSAAAARTAAAPSPTPARKTAAASVGRKRAAAELPPCAVCAHPRARDVLLDLAAGTATVGGAAASLRMPPSEVRRHLTVCDPEGALDEERAATEGPIITTANIERMLAEALSHAAALVRGREGEPFSPHITVKVLPELRALLELAARLTGALTPAGAANAAGPGGLALLVGGDEWAQLTAWADGELTPGTGQRQALAEFLERVPLDLGLDGHGTGR